MSYAPHKATPAPWPRGSRQRATEASPVCRGAFGVLGHSLAHRAREGTSLQTIGVVVALVLIAIVALV